MSERQEQAVSPTSQPSPTEVIRSWSELTSQAGAPASGLTLDALKMSRIEAASLIRFIEKRSSRLQEASAELESLRHALEDACWLARWKRESVIVEVKPAAKANIVEELLSIVQADPVGDDAQLGEQVAVILSRSL